MSMSLFQIFATLLAVGATIVLFVVIRKYNAASSEWRMVSMLERVGLDPTIASSGEPATILEYMIEASMKEIRRRCRACSTVGECEPWLAAGERRGNDFCPNAKVFEALKVICSADARPG